MKVINTYIVLIRGNWHPMYACSIAPETEVIFFIPKIHNNGEYLGELEQVSKEKADTLISNSIS